jgi:hypothetical protein
MLLFFISCEDLQTVEHNPTETSVESLNIKPNKEKNAITWSINMETDELLADGKAILKLVYATDEFLNEYISQIIFIDDKIGYELAIIPYITILDFQWIEVNHTMIEGVLGIQYYKQNVLHLAGDLLPDKPFIVKTMDDDIPRRGISFVDEHGESKYFAIMQNQAEPEERPGRFIIIEFDNI